MKKYFFYAAMAVATMASCTSEDDLTVDPIDPTPDAEEQVALNLGVATPSMTVGSRGTGMVGYVQGDANPVAWDSQELFVAMVNSDGTEYKEPAGTSYFQDLTFRAPKKNGTTQNDGGLIRMYDFYDNDNDEGVLRYKYYPVTGEYTFYGWHKDDATGSATTKFAQDTAIVSNIVIDGSQDLLAANTIAIPDSLIDTTTSTPTFKANASTYNGTYAAAVKKLVDAGDAATYKTMVDKQFSARTARNSFTPVLNFKHTLARLKFHVKAGKGTDAALNFMKDATNDSVRREYVFADSCWVGNPQDTVKYKGMLNGAIYVTGIKVLDVNNDITLNLLNQTATATTAIDTFILKSTPKQVNEVYDDSLDVDKVKLLQELIPVAPTYSYGYNKGGINNATGTESDEIGESIMYLPVTNGTTGTDKQIKIQVQLGQCLIKTEDERLPEGNDSKYTYYWDTPDPVTLTLNASSIVKGGSKLGDAGAFKAGESYNVYITIYGREKIEVSANLVPWVDGGNIDTDIEDGYQN